jgi:hypothetical protein
MLADSGPFIAEHQQRMAQAAADLEFESAARIKARIEQANALGKGPFRHVRPLEQFIFLTLQPAPRPQAAKLFLVVQSGVVEVLGLLDLPSDPTLLIQFIRQAAADLEPRLPDAAAVERMALVAHHLFAPKRAAVPFIPLADLSAATLGAAWRTLRKQPPPCEEVLSGGEPRAPQG